ncbi:hypothetical protein BT69DRAFT_1293621 [Atractiella rhizophila]|nr:hypothetical protein BT69DRAFT_1293621 [Atractiella rhizophila]
MVPKALEKYIVPANCTSVFQPADVRLQKSFKHGTKQKAMQFRITEAMERLQQRNPSEVKLNTSLPHLRDTAISQLLHVWNELGFTTLLRESACQQCMITLPMLNLNLPVESFHGADSIKALELLWSSNPELYSSIMTDPAGGRQGGKWGLNEATVASEAPKEEVEVKMEEDHPQLMDDKNVCALEFPLVSLVQMEFEGHSSGCIEADGEKYIRHDGVWEHNLKTIPSTLSLMKEVINGKWKGLEGVRLLGNLFPNHFPQKKSL